jgi:hypothetical protein
MSRIIIATLAGALLFVPPALADLPAPSGPPNIVLNCADFWITSKDAQDKSQSANLEGKYPRTVMIWSKAGIMTWPAGDKENRYSATVQPGTILYQSPDGLRAGHIDRYSGRYEELQKSSDSPAQIISTGECKVSTAPRKF